MIEQIRGLPELRVKLTRFTPETERQSQIAMRATVDTVQLQVAARAPVGITGDLRKGVLTSVHGNIIWGLQGRVHEVMPYGEVVEFGRRPGGKQPPTGPIEFWVIRKGLAAAGPESRSVAFLIARAIGRRGTIGDHMFEKGFDASRAALDRIWSRVLGAALQNTRLS